MGEKLLVLENIFEGMRFIGNVVVLKECAKGTEFCFCDV